MPDLPLQKIVVGFAWESAQWEPWQDMLMECIPKITHAVLNKICPHHGTGELSFAFVDDQAIQALNNQYRYQNNPTNVLAFAHFRSPIDLNTWTDHTCLGDIILAFETTQKEALDQGKSFENHCIHLLVHGLLHILGCDHQTDEEAELMESLEIEVLKSLGICNPYEQERTE